MWCSRETTTDLVTSNHKIPILKKVKITGSSGKIGSVEQIVLLFTWKICEKFPVGLPQDKNSNQTCEIPAVWRHLANKGEDKSRTVSRLSHRLKLLNSETNYWSAIQWERGHWRKRRGRYLHNQSLQCPATSCQLQSDEQIFTDLAKHFGSYTNFIIHTLFFFINVNYFSKTSAMSTIEHFITFKRVVCTESMFTVFTILFHNIDNFWWCSTKGGGG